MVLLQDLLLVLLLQQQILLSPPQGTTTYNHMTAAYTAAGLPRPALEINRLTYLCPILRWDQSGTYTEPAGECFRAYAVKTGNKLIEYNVWTEKKKDLFEQ